MIAPEDDIEFAVKPVEYENLTFKTFEKILKRNKYFEIVTLFLAITSVIAYIPVSNLVRFFVEVVQNDYDYHYKIVDYLGGYNWMFFVYIAVAICSYNVYKSIDNCSGQKLGAKFYIFQSLKVLFFVFPMLNLFFICALIALFRLIHLSYYSKSKSFK